MNNKFINIKSLKIIIVEKKGIFFTLFLSIIILLIFYGNILKSINSVYFGKEGDGLSVYYSSIYHIKYDSTYSHFQGMNYPYGEHVLFSNCQVITSNTLKFISQNIIDVSDYTVGVINLMMLLSIVIAAVFIFLILKEFHLNWIYSTFVAVGIAYLSPLLNRFPGHYSLSFVFSIPILIYLLIKFYKKPSWKKSIICGLYILLMTTFQMYNLAFAAFIFGVFWIVQIISDKKYRRWKFVSINILLQLVLPFLVINIWLLLTNTIHDRTLYPWGLLVYKSGWEGVFLQHQNITTPFLKSFLHPQPIEWEGWAYIGHIASFLYLFIFTIWACIPFFTTGKMGFFITVIIAGIIIHIIRRNKWKLLNVVDNRILSILLWTGFLSLLFSFAWPFTFYPKLLDYIGTVRQFRAIGRFSWIFYFTINIGVFYFIYQFKIRYKTLKYIVFGASISILYYDAYQNNKNIEQILNNYIPELNDVNNTTIQNQWVSKINPSKFQSIIPLPFFHIGSENIGTGSKCNSAFNTFIVSIKTSLPTNAASMARSSISQSCNNYSIVLEPYFHLDVLQGLKSKKPFLLVVSKCEELSDPEKNLINLSTYIYSNELMSFYELSFEKLANSADSLYDKAQYEIKKNKFKFDKFSTSDSNCTFVFNDFDKIKSNKIFHGTGSYNGLIKNYNKIFEGSIPNIDTSKTYILSFWFGNIKHDLYPRSKMEFSLFDSTGNCYFTDYKAIFSIVKIINNDWALSEYLFKFKNKNDLIKATIWNEELSLNDTLYIDELLIRKKSNNIYNSTQNEIFKNDRYYFKKKTK